MGDTGTVMSAFHVPSSVAYGEEVDGTVQVLTTIEPPEDTYSVEESDVGDRENNAAPGPAEFVKLPEQTVLAALQLGFHPAMRITDRLVQVPDASNVSVQLPVFALPSFGRGDPSAADQIGASTT